MSIVNTKTSDKIDIEKEGEINLILPQFASQKLWLQLILDAIFYIQLDFVVLPLL